MDGSTLVPATNRDTRRCFEADLEHREKDSLRGPIQNGHHTMAYWFVGLGDKADQAFGATIKEVLQGGELASRPVVRIRFYHDLFGGWSHP